MAKLLNRNCKNILEMNPGDIAVVVEDNTTMNLHEQIIQRCGEKALFVLGFKDYYPSYFNLSQADILVEILPPGTEIVL